MRLSSDSILRASIAAAWLASAVLAIPQPQVVGRVDPPQSPPPAPPTPIATTADQLGIDSTQPNTTTASSPPPPPPQGKPPIPITLQLYASSPGTKTCRGSSFVRMGLPANASTDPVLTSKDGQCYNLQETAQCGIFQGNKADGCEAKLFRGERCTAFSNLAVFQEELRPVGGYFMSISIKCGVVPVEPKPLSLGNLGGQLKKPPKGSKGARAVDAAMQAA